MRLGFYRILQLDRVLSRLYLCCINKIRLEMNWKQKASRIALFIT